MRISNFSCTSRYNQTVNGKVRILKQPHYRIAFDLSESVIMGLLKKALNPETRAEAESELGTQVFNHLIAYHFGHRLQKHIKEDRKRRLVASMEKDSP